MAETRQIGDKISKTLPKTRGLNTRDFSRKQNKRTMARTVNTATGRVSIVRKYTQV